MDGGNGQAGARSSDIHLGLGSTPPGTLLNVDLHWRDATGQVWKRTLQLAPGWRTILLGE